MSKYVKGDYTNCYEDICEIWYEDNLYCIVRLEDADKIIRVLNENEQLKKENQRMTDKLNELALEFLNYDMVTMGKATEISEMCYYDFLKYRKDNGNPMELQL